jgi:acyl CoA:acetate/3-ketoacid CoA transferase beta subunit
VEAIRAKVSYAKQNGLLGYNVFQVGNDDNWVLSRAGTNSIQFTTWKVESIHTVYFFLHCDR